MALGAHRTRRLCSDRNTGSLAATGSLRAGFVIPTGHVAHLRWTLPPRVTLYRRREMSGAIATYLRNLRTIQDDRVRKAL